MKEDNLKISDWVLNMHKKEKNLFTSLKTKINYITVTIITIILKLIYLKIELHSAQFSRNNKVIKKDWSASMIDIDDGVLGVELHSVLKPDFNPLDGSMVSVS